MSEQENRTVVQASFDAFSAHDLVQLSQWWAADLPFRTDRLYLQGYLSQVSALRQPGLPKPTWVHIGLLLVTLYYLGVLPGFWEAVVAGPAMVIAPGFWVGLAGIVVL